LSSYGNAIADQIAIISFILYAFNEHWAVVSVKIEYAHHAISIYLLE